MNIAMPVQHLRFRSAHTIWMTSDHYRSLRFDNAINHQHNTPGRIVTPIRLTSGGTQTQVPLKRPLGD
jgi:hypothetical protein